MRIRNIHGSTTPILIDMASYLSYFTSNNPSQPPAQQQYSNLPQSNTTWSSTFSSRIGALRKALTKDSEEDDEDNEDSSHVSNVLRAYYQEKGRAFPEWLPPDPKRPAPIAQQPSTYGQYGIYGHQYGSQPTHGRGNSGGRAGLSDLFDSNPPPPTPLTQSLRAPRPTPQSLRSQDPGRSQSGSSSGGNVPVSLQAGGGRPLPSQRMGSQQTAQAGPSATVGALGSRDRLRARLQGGGSGRSSPAAGGQLSYGGSNNYGNQASERSGSPYVAASEPWSDTSNSHGGYDTAYGNSNSSNNRYGSSEYRNRPGGPR